MHSLEYLLVVLSKRIRPLHRAHDYAFNAKNSYECHDLNVAALGDFGILSDGRGGQ